MYVFAAVLQALLLTACSSDENLSDGTLKIIAGIGEESTSGVTTRSLKTGTAFSIGEAIGIFITGESYTPAATVYTKVENSAWTGNAINLSNSVATVYGYYPSSLTPTINGTSSTVPATVLTTITTNGFDAATDNTSIFDYMYAVETGSTSTPASQKTVTKASPSATLTFKHALAQLVFIVKKTSTFGGTGTLTNITLTQPSGSYFKGGSTAGTMLLTNGTLTFPASTENTINLTDSKSINESGASATTATVLVAPASATSISLSMTIDDQPYTLESGKYLPTGTTGATFSSWEAGKIYTYTVNVEGGTLSIGASDVSITDWTTGGTIDESTIK